MTNWKIKTLHDAYQERPPVRYAVKGLIEVPSLNIVYGAPSTLKSMLLIDLSINLVRGQSWLKNDEGIPSKLTVKTPVLWVDLDNGPRRTEDRAEAVGRHYGALENDEFFYVSMPSNGLNMKLHENYKELEDAIAEYMPSGGVVVVDNLGYVIGDVDENSHGMAMIMSNFRTIAERYDVAFMIVHHQRKGNGLPGRAGESLRGHSSIEAALDLALLVEREEGSNRVDIRATKVRGFEVRPFSALYRFDGNEDKLRQAWFVGLDSNGVERRTEKAIMKFLTAGKRNKKQLEEMCKAEDSKITPSQVDAGLRRLMAAGLVGEEPGKKKEKLFFLKGADQLEIHYSHEIQIGAE